MTVTIVPPLPDLPGSVEVRGGKAGDTFVVRVPDERTMGETTYGLTSLVHKSVEVKVDGNGFFYREVPW